MISKILFLDLDGEFNKWINIYFNGINGIECETMRVKNYKPSSSERVAYMSPLNNTGIMDSGIDLEYNLVMFRNINITVKKKIFETANYLKSKNVKMPPEMNMASPYLSVGSSLLIPIEGTMHYLIGAPTLSNNDVYNDTPKNAYYAFKAVFKLLHNYIRCFGEHKIDTLIVPALCCGSSCASPKESAHEIFTAYFDCVMGMDNDKPLYVTPSIYLFKTDEYMTTEKLIELNKKNSEYLGISYEG